MQGFRYCPHTIWRNLLLLAFKKSLCLIPTPFPTTSPQTVCMLPCWQLQPLGDNVWRVASSRTGGRERSTPTSQLPSPLPHPDPPQSQWGKENPGRLDVPRRGGDPWQSRLEEFPGYTRLGSDVAKRDKRRYIGQVRKTCGDRNK